MHVVAWHDISLMISVNKETAPPEKHVFGNISCQSTTSGRGLDFLLLDRMVKAPSKGVFSFADTGM